MANIGQHMDFNEDAELRKKNLETIYEFLKCAGPDRNVTRRPLFAPGAKKEMELRTPEGVQLQQQDAFEWLEESVKIGPQWGFYENQIFQCDDPNHFLVKCVGRGNSCFGPEPQYYIRYYINEFVMQDGKIMRFREIFNPCEEWHL